MQTIEDYLPYLYGIIGCIDGEQLKPRAAIGKLGSGFWCMELTLVNTLTLK